MTCLLVPWEGHPVCQIGRRWPGGTKAGAGGATGARGKERSRIRKEGPLPSLFVRLPSLSLRGWQYLFPVPARSFGFSSIKAIELELFCDEGIFKVSARAEHGLPLPLAAHFLFLIPGESPKPQPLRRVHWTLHQQMPHQRRRDTGGGPSLLHKPLGTHSSDGSPAP